MQKPQKMRLLRKTLALRLAPLEEKMLSGEFHDTKGKFKQDYFFDEVSPIVYSITGPPEDCSDEELPHQCLVMAKDIMKKRKQYEDRKRKMAQSAPKPDKKPKLEKPKVEKSAKPTSKPTSKSTSKPSKPSKRSRKKKLFVPVEDDATPTSEQIDALFDDRVDARVDMLGFNCNNCSKSITRAEAIPVQIGDTPASRMLCKKCYKTSCAILDAVDLSNSQHREEKNAELPAKPSKSNKTSKSKKPRKSKKTSKFKVGQYVLSKFPGYEDWFQCEVFGKYRGKYNIYFLVDGAVLKHVDEDTLQEPEPGEWTKLKRADFLNKSFKMSDKQWQAVEIGKARRINKYKCEAVESDDKSVCWLDISKVQKIIRGSCPSQELFTIRSS